MTPGIQLKQDCGCDRIKRGEGIIRFDPRHNLIGTTGSSEACEGGTQDWRPNPLGQFSNGGIMVAQGHSFSELVVVKTGDARESFPELGLARKVLVYNDKLMLVEHRMRKGWAGALHSHPHEQIAYVVSGRLSVTCLDQTFEVGTGDSFLVRGGVKHGASALEDSVVVDIFTPCREDYIPMPSM